MRAFRRYCRLFRTALLVLLVLGMVVSPVLAAVGELHGLEHAAMASGDGAHDHAHSTESDHHDHHDHHGGGVDPEHATGGHGLMHQTGSVSVTLPDAALDISMQSPSERLLPEFGGFHLPGDSPSLPFRPPIS